MFEGYFGRKYYCFRLNQASFGDFGVILLKAEINFLETKKIFFKRNTNLILFYRNLVTL